jgi:hypothetical protein
MRDITDAQSALYLRKWIDRRSSKRKLRVITLVREPVARDVSLFFFHGTRIAEFVDHYNKDLIAVPEIVDAFLDMSSETGQYLLTWFDSEMKPVFGIDVFDEDFPKSRGYKIYEGKHAQLLLLKLEKLNDCARDAFEEFLGVKDISLVKANVGDNQEYGSLYRAFKEECVLPQAYLDEMYQSAYAQHFYSEEEIGQFIAKWNKGGGTGQNADRGARATVP